MKELTRAEEQIMHILWRLKKAMVREILEHMPEPRPAYNTVSTVVRILETKGFIGHRAYGKTHLYFPTVTKEVYTRFSLNNLITSYFNGSFHNLVSFFTRNAGMSLEEMDQLLQQLDARKTKLP